jgi:hypothetical protein
MFQQRRLLLLVAVSLLAACARTTHVNGDERSSGAPPSVVQLVCSASGARLLTPTVSASPDGVHFQVGNTTGAPASVVLESSAGDVASSVPSSGKSFVEPVPPGTAEVGCVVGTGPGEIGHPDLHALRVLDPDGLYASGELDCPGGTISQEGLGEATEKSLLAQARKDLSAHMRASDELEPAGYPESAHHLVKVARDGATIAVATYVYQQGSWVGISLSACDSFLA